MHFAIDPTSIDAIVAALGFLVLDWILGIVSAVSRGTFSISLVPKQFMTTIALAGMGFSFSGLLQALTSGTLSTSLVAFIVASAASVSAMALNDIRLKIAGMRTGAPTVSTMTLFFGQLIK